MDTLIIVLAFLLIRYAMNMAFLKRGRKATKCDTLLLGSLPMSKAFTAMTAYFNQKKNLLK
ncbi:hypothetical protein [uncultured Flavobacterium sp.]|uniref:hypothetical protein n=1 Tax=uncultured Flavobacterium sp. TaxID=165435 RepID=UPI0025E52847|nr:hypothetical protein [uncultured Flavobacterium sp.]